jgi:hypothetical protein
MENKTESNIQVVPRGHRLPYWQKPRNSREAISKINNALREWSRTTDEMAYRVGGWYLWLKNKLPHGEFQLAVAQTQLKMRTVQNFMRHRRECDMMNRILPYHPNPKARGENATVALLESPEDPDEIQRLKKSKPRLHDSEPLNWNATESARKLFEIYEKFIEHRKIDEMEEVAQQFEDLVRDYIDSRREDRLMIGGELD